MREINFKVYSYDELSDEAKRVAIEKSRQSVGDVCSEFESDDYRTTLNKIEQIFGIEVKNGKWGFALARGLSLVLTTIPITRAKTAGTYF